MTKVIYPLGLCVGLFIYVAYVKWHRASATQAFFSISGMALGAQGGPQAHSPQETAPRGLEVFYGIMFDAGSTGTRVHVFQFARLPGETPTLTHETFKALKPGLSAYADDVEKSAQGIQELLDVAKQDIPFDFWKATPLVLKATAGLRLLPGAKAQKLLQKVEEVFKASPFLVGDDCVSIMNGTDEALSVALSCRCFGVDHCQLPDRQSEDPGQEQCGHAGFGRRVHSDHLPAQCGGHSAELPAWPPDRPADVQQDLQALLLQLPRAWTHVGTTGDLGRRGRGAC